MADYKFDRGELRDRRGSKVAVLDGKYIRDRRGSRLGEIDGKYFRDNHGTRLAEFDETELVTRRDVPQLAVAYWPHRQWHVSRHSR
jgi:hypothetical protein